MYQSRIDTFLQADNLEVASKNIPSDTSTVEQPTADIPPTVIDEKGVIRMLQVANRNFKQENSRLKLKISELQKQIESYKCILDKFNGIKDLLSQVSDNVTDRQVMNCFFFN